MKLLASALILAGLSFTVPAHASGDVAADRHYAQTATNRRAATQAVSVPDPATPKHDCAASCPCTKRVGRVTHDANATRREPGRR